MLYTSGREAAPVEYARLWTVPVAGGPSARVPSPWGAAGSFSPDGGRIVVERVGRWDSEWRGYRGGQNTPLTVLDLPVVTSARANGAFARGADEPVDLF